MNKSKPQIIEDVVEVVVDKGHEINFGRRWGISEDRVITPYSSVFICKKIVPLTTKAL